MITLPAKSHNEAFTKRHGAYKTPTLPPAIQKMADSVSYRLETPRLKIWKGEDGQTRTQTRNTGFVDRRLSPSDREEVAGACIQALAASGELECVTRCGLLFRPHFHASIIPAFSLARKTLEMGESSHSRRLASFSLDAHLGTDNELSPFDGVMIRASLEEGKRSLSRAESKHNPRRSQLAKMFRGLRSLAKRARALDSSRKSKASYRSAMGMIRLAVIASNGGSLGEWLELPQTLRDCQLSRFRSYLKPAIADLARGGEGEESTPTPRLESASLAETMSILFPTPTPSPIPSPSRSQTPPPPPSPSQTIPAFNLPPSRFHEGKVIAGWMRNNRKSPTLPDKSPWPFMGIAE